MSFSVQEHSVRAWEMGCGHGYGAPGNPPEDQRGDIFLPCMTYGDAEWTKPEYAEAWLLATLRAQGVELAC